MKIIITTLVIACFLGTTSTAAAFDWNVPWKEQKQSTATTEATSDKHGGYSETRRDYKARGRRTMESKKDAGYYDGKYHNKGKNYRKGEWQFVEDN